MTPITRPLAVLPLLVLRPADIVAVQGDPTQRDVFFVMKGGKTCKKQ